MSSKGRLVLVLAAAAVFYSFLIWLAFSTHSWKGPVVIAIFTLGLVPIYPLYRILRKRAGSSALAILLLMVAVICGLAYFAGDLILRTDAGWVSVASRLSESLIIGSCVLFIWNGLVRRNRQ
jgi:hypothetical protein